MSKKLVIIGASGHGKVVANIAKLNSYKEILFLDDNESRKECGLYQVVGTSNRIDELIKENYDFVVAIGDNSIRKHFFEQLKNKGANLPVLVHPTAIVDDTVTICNGTVLMANVVINANVVIGNACIINTMTSIDHDGIIKDYVHISPGVNIAGSVMVGDSSWIGIGTKISNNLEIIDNIIIGAGSVVVKDILSEGTYVGAPARKVK